MCSQSSAILRMSALSAGLSDARLFVGSAKHNKTPIATRIPIAFPDISILLLRCGKILNRKEPHCPSVAAGNGCIDESWHDRVQPNKKPLRKSDIDVLFTLLDRGHEFLRNEFRGIDIHAGQVGIFAY